MFLNRKNNQPAKYDYKSTLETLKEINRVSNSSSNLYYNNFL